LALALVRSEKELSRYFWAVVNFFENLDDFFLGYAHIDKKLDIFLVWLLLALAEEVKHLSLMIII